MCFYRQNDKESRSRRQKTPINDFSLSSIGISNAESETIKMPLLDVVSGGESGSKTSGCLVREGDFRYVWHNFDLAFDTHCIMETAAEDFLFLSPGPRRPSFFIPVLLSPFSPLN